MNLVLCMAGLYQRFRQAGYETPKYLLPFREKTVIEHVLDPLWSSGAFSRVLLVANRRDREHRSRIAAILRARGLDADDLLFIDDTRGQAETAAIAGRTLAADPRVADRRVVFHNVDTVLVNRDCRAIAAALQKADGYIDVFASREPCFSFVSLDEQNRVTAIAEKRVISPWATSGLYGFSSVDRYLEDFDRAGAAAGEQYISDVYRHMLSHGATIVTNRPAASEATIVLGTPEQYEVHRQKSRMNERAGIPADDAIVLDLDGTLTVDDKAVAYPDKPANGTTLAAAHSARARGYRVVVATSRNMRTYRGDLAQIRRHTQPAIEDWLAREGLAPDDLAIGKAWCGPRGFYVDDRNMHVEEFVFRFQGPYAACSVDVLYLPPAEDLDALADAHARHRKLERLFHVARFIYPQARFQAALPCALRDDPRIDWASTGESTDFAGHIDCLTRHAKSDWLLIVASGRPADPYPLFLVHQDALRELPGPAVVASWSPRHGVELLLAPRAQVRQACAVGPEPVASLADLAARLPSGAIEWLLDPSGADAQPPWARPRAEASRNRAAG